MPGAQTRLLELLENLRLVLAFAELLSRLKALSTRWSALAVDLLGGSSRLRRPGTEPAFEPPAPYALRAWLYQLKISYKRKVRTLLKGESGSLLRCTSLQIGISE